MDPIANMLSSLKNAGLAGREKVVLSHSKEKEAIANVLKSEGFVRGVEKKTKDGKPALEISLILENRVPKIKGVRRLSKPSRRLYTKAKDIRPIRQGYGILVVTTPKGVMAGYRAKKEGLGGEKLFSIW